MALGYSPSMRRKNKLSERTKKHLRKKPKFGKEKDETSGMQYKNGFDSFSDSKREMRKQFEFDLGRMIKVCSYEGKNFGHFAILRLSGFRPEKQK